MACSDLFIALFSSYQIVLVTILPLRGDNLECLLKGGFVPHDCLLRANSSIGEIDTTLCNCHLIQFGLKRKGSRKPIIPFLGHL